MYYNKKRTKIIVLLGVALLLSVCGCAIEVPEQKIENIAGDVTDMAEQGGTEISEAANGEEIEIAGEVKSTEPVETQPVDMEEEEPADEGKTEAADTEDSTELVVTDILKEMEPEERVLYVLTNAEGVHFNSDGMWETELLGYAEEKDVAYFVIKKKKNPEALEPRGGEMIYIGVLNPETGELIYVDGRGGENADGNMVVKETGTYIIYAAGWTAQGLIGGEAGVYRTEAGELVPVWPVTASGEYDEAYWNMHTVSLKGEALEIYKVIITEVRPDGIANDMITEPERTVTLDEILAGAV